MMGPTVGYKHGDGSRGVNVQLVTWWEVNPDGSALLHFMGGSMLPVQKEQWAIVGPMLQPPNEPAAVAQSNAAGAPPAAQS